MEKLKILLFEIIYVSFLFIFVISAFFPYFLYTGNPQPQEVHFSGIMYLEFGGWFGIVFIFISIKKVQDLYLIRAIEFGIIGCILIGINWILIIIFPLNRSLILTNASWLGIFMWIGFCFINFILLILHLFRRNLKSEMLIRKTILDLGTKFSRLEVREVSEVCKIDRATIIDIIKEMITNNEIYADYFSSSKTVAFNQLANVDEIDNLISIYKKWEAEKFDKK